jgi:transposase-like protein
MKKTSAPSQATPVKVKRRHYQEQFKRDAVAMLQSGRSATQLARELGVSQWNLRDWKDIYGAASIVDLAVQLADMRRELNAVISQRDILKKALAIVAMDPLSATR